MDGAGQSDATSNRAGHLFYSVFLDQAAREKPLLCTGSVHLRTQQPNVTSHCCRTQYDSCGRLSSSVTGSATSARLILSDQLHIDLKAKIN